MLKQIFLAAGAVILAAGAKGQAPEPLVAKVAYTFIHIIDKQKSDTLHREELVLRIGKHNSFYNTYPFAVAIQPREEVPPPTSGGGVTRVYTGRPMAVVNDWGITSYELVQNPVEKKLIRNESVGLMSYEITEKFPEIKWTITTDTKKLGDYTCQQATATFGGRNYTAWFTSELPFAVGPWKLNGLPGVILEAYDDKQEVFFLYKRLALAETGELTENERSKAPLKVTNEALAKAKKAFEDNPSGVVQAQSGVSGEVSVRFRDRKGKFHSGDEAARLLAEKSKTEKLVSKNALELSK